MSLKVWTLAVFALALTAGGASAQVGLIGKLEGRTSPTVPGVREALEQRNWNEVTDQIGVAAEVLESFALAADRTARLLPR